MSKVAGKSTRIWLDAINLSGSLTAADLDVTQEAPDVTCFSDNGPRAVVGNYGTRFTLRGLFDGSSSNIDAVSDTLIGSTEDHYLAQAFAGTAEAAVVYESMAHAAGKSIRVPVGQAVAQEIPMVGAGGLARSLVLANGTVSSTLGLLSSIDQGPLASGTYQAVFRAFSGTFTNVILAIQESSNDSTWGVGSTALQATFTVAGATRVSTTAATLRYKRVAATTFVGTSVEVAVTGGIVAGSTPQAT